MRPALARTKIGRFELLHRFAIGGMGEIFLARERGVAGFDRQVVVKLLIPELAEQPDLVTLFIDEARIAANLAHPNIVQIFDFGRDDGSYFLAMEYVPGQNLARLCARAVRDPRGLFTRELAVHVVAEMARGLDHAHRAKDADGKPLGIVHRDVSPHNLLLSIHGDVKVMDFGIAKAANTLHRTATGVIRGKYGYMSPEQLAGEDLDLTTDVYSAGIVLWELTLMRRLWPGADELAVLDQARSGKVPRPTEIDPSYPRDLEEIVMHAIARDRGQRTASAGALAADLRGWLALQGAVIDRAALGAVVTTLFPEIDHEMPFRPDPDPDPRTASLPKAPEPPPEPPTEPTEPTATTTPASPPHPPAPLPQLPRRGSRRGAVIAVMALVAIGGGGLAVWSLRDGDAAPTAPTPATQPTVAVVDAGAAQVVVAAAAADASAPRLDAAELEPDARVPATTPVKKPVGTPRTSPPRDVKPVVTAGSATPPATPTTTAPPAPALGWLAIELTPWGTFRLPNQSPLTTPRKVQLPPGDYPITMTFSESGATIRGTATVTANATTRCKATPAEGLSCQR